MIYLIYGAAGTLLVLALLGLGAAAGWKAHEAWRDNAVHVAAQEADEEERRRIVAEQRAFDSLLNYNMDTAYGLNTGLDELTRGED